MKKFLALLLAATMLCSITAAFAEAADTPLVVATSTLSAKFSPYFADTQYDQDVMAHTQILMMTEDRTGAIIYNGIEGETHSYNGTDYTYYGPADLYVNYDEAADKTTYGIKLREDLYFSDGVQVTADDIIFNYYVFLDPAYNGSTTLNSYDIVGLKAYLSQVPEDALATVSPIEEAIEAAGLNYTVDGTETFTADEYAAYVEKVTANAKAAIAELVDYVYGAYGYAYFTDAFTDDQYEAEYGLKVAAAMASWGFGEYADGVFTDSNGTAWDLTTAYPSVESWYDCMVAAYGDIITAYGNEMDGYVNTTLDVSAEMLSLLAADHGVDMSAGVPNISGITKIDDYTVEVVTNGFSAPAVYTILGLYIAPMHYYGDPDQYDYENNKFGHPYGDLSICQSNEKMTHPLGAGPYVFQSYENRVVYYTANENYYQGAPLIKSMQYKETNDSEVATAVQTGTADGGELTGSKSNFQMLRDFNSNGEVTGDVVTTYSVANLGYGYIGICADNVKVGDDPASTESKDLRKALATVLAVYRDTAFNSYYGDAAAVINYPISSTSWAAPQATDEGYRVAYSVDVDGNDIYTSDMTTEDKYVAALEAAKGYLIAAGYTYDEAQGIFTAAPEGAKLSYEVIIPADGQGDHPSFAVLTDARNALATIGIELKINDPADSNVLWDSLDAGTQELWCAAWSSTVDPDMYQIYHSSNIVGLGGSDSNHYHIRSAELDELILNARSSADQSYRKELYKAALEEIMDWAVEIPAYQRQNIVIASTQRVDTSTVTGDVTTYWGWLSDVQTMQMNATK